MARKQRPPILILQHYKENLRKCSLSHIRRLPGVEFRRLKIEGRIPQFPGLRGLVLAVHAPLLSANDAEVFRSNAEASLIVLDGTWAKVDALVRNIRAADREEVVDETAIRDGRLGALWFRSLPSELATAYPRKSKIFPDPETGLASIEALVAALEILDCPARDLLDGYRWGQEFLDKNPQLFRG